MKLADFNTIVRQKKKDNPFWFEDEHEILAADDSIKNAENQLSVILPDTYKQFVKYYGGGYFAFTNIFSVDENGEWYIVEKNYDARSYLPNNFIAISDDETGGFYGYNVVDGKCNEDVFYWDHDSATIGDKLYKNVFEYITMVGLTD